MNTIITKTVTAPPVCQKELLHYAQIGSDNTSVLNLLTECINESQNKFIYKVCYCLLNVTINDDICNFGTFSVKSKNLAINLKGCSKVLLFGATIGVYIDRLISKYSRISPTKALIFQAIGTERIESLCDTFCGEYSKEKNVNLKPRFSPGYGDLSLETQKDIFIILDCPRKIGVTLNESFLMSPSKSVTAFVGICDT